MCGAYVDDLHPSPLAATHHQGPKKGTFPSTLLSNCSEPLLKIQKDDLNVDFLDLSESVCNSVYDTAFFFVLNATVVEK